MPSSDYRFDDSFFDEDAETTRIRRSPLHWSQMGKRYFVTWRLADSLAQKALARIEADCQAWRRGQGGKSLVELHLSLQRKWCRLFHHRAQRRLDAGHGSCMLRKPVARQIAVDALRHFHGERNHLGSFAVAGNQVHMLVAPNEGVELSGVIHSW